MKLIVYLHGISEDRDKPQYVNISVDRMAYANDFLQAFQGERLVALFDLGTVLAAYLSEEKGKRRDGNAVKDDEAAERDTGD